MSLHLYSDSRGRTVATKRNSLADLYLINVTPLKSILSERHSFTLWSGWYEPNTLEITKETWHVRHDEISVRLKRLKWAASLSHQLLSFLTYVVIESFWRRTQVPVAQLGLRSKMQYISVWKASIAPAPVLENRQTKAELSVAAKCVQQIGAHANFASLE